MRFKCVPFSRGVMLAASLFVSGMAPAQAEYRLDAGDVLEIAVYGVADFSRRANVNIDGHVAVPFLGEVRAAGLSVGNLRKEVERRLEEEGAFQNPHVTVELVEHRPFYISGDVARPGAHPFRPGLTVRHAIALAGGYDAMRYRTENPLLAIPEIQSRYESLWIDLIARQARVLVVRAELEAREEIDVSVLYDAPLSRATIDELAGLETEELGIRLAEYRKEMEHLGNAIEQATGAVETLEKVVGEQEESLGRQMAAADRAVANSARGVTPGMRVDEEQRAVAYLRGQHMDAITRLMNAHREVDQYRRNMEKASNERQQRLLGELREATSELEQIKSQLRSAGEQLIYTGMLRTRLRQDDTSPVPELTVMRPNGNEQERILVTEDSPMQPGDVLNVALAPERLLVMPGH